VYGEHSTPGVQERDVDGETHAEHVDPLAGHQIDALVGVDRIAAQQAASAQCARSRPQDLAGQYHVATAVDGHRDILR
jgi:hypothetical protein